MEQHYLDDLIGKGESLLMVKVYKSQNEFDEIKFNKFCKKYDFMFPKELVNYLKEYNDSRLEDNIIKDSEYGVYIRNFYGTSREDYLDISTNYDCYIGRLPYKCVPIADPEFGNQICISLSGDSYGKIYFWDHEIMDTEDGERCTLSVEDMVLLANSFDELLEKIVEFTFDMEEKNIKHIKITERIKKIFKIYNK